MREYRLEREQLVVWPRDETFELFGDASNLAAITPPWLQFEIVTPMPVAMGVGAELEYRLRLHRVPVRWLTAIVEWDPPRRFVDVQMRGPYALWHHTHEFLEVGGQTLMRDTVRYALPFGPLGRIAHPLLVKRDLKAIFDYRQEAVTRLTWARP